MPARRPAQHRWTCRTVWGVSYCWFCYTHRRWHLENNGRWRVWSYRTRSAKKWSGKMPRCTRRQGP